MIKIDVRGLKLQTSIKEYIALNIKEYIIVSLMFLGTAVFSTLIHEKNSKVIWMSGIVIMFAGIYFMYSIDGISFWNKSTVSNTIVLGCSMMFYMLFLSTVLVHFMKDTKKEKEYEKQRQVDHCSP